MEGDGFSVKFNNLAYKVQTWQNLTKQKNSEFRVQNLKTIKQIQQNNLFTSQ